jgi:hypothetical protein
MIKGSVEFETLPMGAKSSAPVKASFITAQNIVAAIGCDCRCTEPIF